MAVRKKFTIANVEIEARMAASEYGDVILQEDNEKYEKS